MKMHRMFSADIFDADMDGDESNNSKENKVFEKTKVKNGIML